MNSISPECQELKEKYDACFNKWFSEKFLKGNTKDECGALFEVYQDCVKVNKFSMNNSDHVISWSLYTLSLGMSEEAKGK